MVYLASSLSLAALEYLVHVDPDEVPDDLMAMSIVIPTPPPLARWTVDELPVDWRSASVPVACHQHGDAWLDGRRALGVMAPSVLVPEEANVLLNPRHARMTDVSVESVRPFTYDPRLIR